MPPFAWLGGITCSWWEWLRSRRTSTKYSASIIRGTTSATARRWRSLSRTQDSVTCPFTSSPSLSWLTSMSVSQRPKTPLSRLETDRRFTHASSTGLPRRLAGSVCLHV
ncbi:hypothetical protein M758_UG117900 [Ceratodon purpureus]|nr:hypothetical protein M758_UG117900 [Ceratodon purpureus]